MSTDPRDTSFEAVHTSTAEVEEETLARSTHRRRSDFEDTLTRTAEGQGREAGGALPRASLWKDAYYRFIKNKASVVAAVAFVALLAFCIFVPIFSNEDPYAVDFSQAYEPPSLEHPFGTDQFGRDVFVRTALGGRVSFAIGFAATFAIMLVGITYGATSGFIGGKLDNALMRFLDALYGLPYLPFAILTLAIFGTVNFWTMVVALTIASWFTTARVMRGQIMTLKQNDYVRAAYAVGASRQRVLWRHLLINTLGIIIVFVFLELPGVILGEAFLSFIGLGINPPKASWGTLAQDGYTEYQVHPWLIVIPSLMIAWLILSAFFIADGLRDALDPRMKEA